MPNSQTDNAMTETRELLRNACLDLLSGQQTVFLATTSSEGVPEASYAPYLFRRGDFYLFVSLLARHTRNLTDTGRASLLFVEEASQAHQPFARRRLSFQCRAEPVAKDSEAYAVTLSRFHRRFGGIIKTLAGLDDFRLFRLHPHRCRYVQGFGRAYDFDRQQLQVLEHLQGI